MWSRSDKIYTGCVNYLTQTNILTRIIENSYNHGKLLLKIKW